MSRGFFLVASSVVSSLFNLTTHWFYPDSTLPVVASPHPKKKIHRRTHAAEKDRITDLPGLEYDPGFEQFGGYLDVSPSRHVYYWYVESQSDPDHDPVVLWTK